MVNTKNEHLFHRNGVWVVKREGSKKSSELFDSKKDATEYAGIVASNDSGFVVTHKFNGQFKAFKRGSRIHVRTHKIAPIITGTIEIAQPIVTTFKPMT